MNEKLITLEELQALGKEEQAQKVEELQNQAQELLDKGDLENAEKIIKLLQDFKKVDKTLVSNDEPKTEPQNKPEQLRSDLRELEVRNLVTRATQGVTTPDINIQAAIGALKVKNTFDIANHVTVNVQKNAVGKLPETTISEFMIDVAELADNPEMASSKMPLTANPFDTKTYRKYIAFSEEMLQDSIPDAKESYITSIANQTIANTKLVEIKKAIEADKPAVALDKTAFITALGALDNGQAQLLANKANIIKVMDLVNSETIVGADGELYMVISGIKVKVIELPKNETAVLLFNKESVEVVQSEKTPDSFRVTDLPESNNVTSSFYSRALYVVTRFDVLVSNGTSFKLA